MKKFILRRQASLFFQSYLAIAATALCVISGIAFAHASAPAAAPPLVAGDYVSERSRGLLTLKPGKNNAQPFMIESVGANGHTCSLEGELRNGRATLEAAEKNAPCVVTMTATPSGIVVTASESGACQYYCGVRATFDATYFKPAPACREKAVTATRNAFKRQYDAKKFTEARATLEPLLKHCTRSLYWLDEGRIRNDLSVTLHKLGHFAACRDVLKPLADDANATDEALQARYPPTDLESVMPIVRSTRTNLRLCAAK